MKRFTLIIFAIILYFYSEGVCWGEPFQEQKIIQEQFACELVRGMHLEGWLPLSALPRDCISVLEQFGISPMQGWNNTAYLTKEDYLVILSKAHGKEIPLYETAEAIEKKNIALINQRWQEAYNKEGRWLSLEELFQNKTYFPNGVPKSPYGHAYEDSNHDHHVDVKFSPFLGLMQLRKFLSSYK